MADHAARLLDETLRTGDPAALDAAIDLFRQALAATPPGHPDRPLHMYNLGLALGTRGERTGSLADLDAAVDVGQAAVEATPPGDADRAEFLTTLTAALDNRFERTGSLADLDAAIAAAQAAVEATPPGDADRARRLFNLGVVLDRLFERTGSLADLDAAIAAGRAAAGAAPPGHPDRARCLTALGGTLGTRGERTGSLADLDAAVDAAQAAVEAAPPGHPDRAEYLSNLVAALHRRGKRTGSLADLDAAIAAAQAAVEATPPGDPDRAESLITLTATLAKRFEPDYELIDYARRGEDLSKVEYPEQDQQRVTEERGPASYEQIVVSVRPHWYWFVGPTVRVAIVLLLAGAGVAFLSSWPGTETVQYVILAVAVILLVRSGVVPWLRWRTTRYVVTTERLVVNAGVVRRSTIDIPLGRIGEVGSRSSLVENLFGCGTLVVASRDGRDVLELPRTPKVTDVGMTLLAHGAG